MLVNSIQNYGIKTFRGSEAPASQKTQETVEQPVKVQAQAPNSHSEILAKDTVEVASKVQTQDIPKFPMIKMPTIDQVTKMQKFQTIGGATLMGLGVLGALSALSPKKWTRLLFTIPVGGIVGLFGLNMYKSGQILKQAMAERTNIDK